MMDPKELMAEAAVLEPQLQNWRRTLHRHPEVGFDLPQTRALVKQALTKFRIAKTRKNKEFCFCLFYFENSKHLLSFLFWLIA